MAYGSRNDNRGEDPVKRLDALRNPFTLAGRYIKGGVTSVDDMLRGIGRAGGAILSDVIAEPVRGLVPGGKPGWWLQEDGNRAASTYRDLLTPVGKSFANTLDALGDITYLTNLSPGWQDGGVGRANEQFMQRLQELNDDPFNFTLEHVGNVALVGALAAKPAQLGIASSRGAVTGPQAAQGLRPLAGRPVRATARQATAEAAEQGSRVAKGAIFTEDVIAHPYRSAVRGIRNSKYANLVRDPGSVDPVTDTVNKTDDLGENPSADVPTTKLYRGMAEEFDPARVPEGGTRFTDDLDYALSNVNEGQHPYLYEVEVPESRVDVGTSEFADLMGEGAGPRGAVLGIDELEGLRQVDPDVVRRPTLEELRNTTEGMEDFESLAYQRYADIPEEYRRYLPDPDDFEAAMEMPYYYHGTSRPIGTFRGGGISSEWARSAAWSVLDEAGEVLVFDPSDFPASVREALEGGFDIEQSSDLLSMLEEAGVDVPQPVARIPASEIYGFRSPQTTLNMPEQMTKNRGGGTSTDPNHQLGFGESVAQAVGYALEGIQKSEGYQSIFGEDARLSRQVRDQYREALLRGTGAVADAVRERLFDKKTPIGNVNVRRKWDPSRVERLFLRDLKNLGKRADAEQYQGLLNDIEFDKVTPRSVPGRVGAVASGSRVVGQTLDPEGLLTRIQRVMDEVNRRASGPEDFDVILQEMLPGVDAMGLHLLALNALERAQGLPENSLTNALSDYVTLDRYSGTNRQAQALMRAAGRDVDAATGSRFRLPEEELGVDLNALPEEAQNIFYSAAEQYRRDLAANREPLLVEEGVVPAAGTRVGLAADQPTQFPTSLEDLPLTKEWRRRIRNAERDVSQRERVIEDVVGELEELATSGRALYKPRRSAEGGVYRTQTGEALRRRTQKLNRERKKLETSKRKLAEVEAAARVAVENAPASARNLLLYSTRVAPEQARILREMASEGVGDSVVLNQVADELDAIPKTIEDLNSADVYVAYLRDIKDVTAPGEMGPGISTRQRIDTRTPGGARRRGTQTDIDYSRDFRARAYWQDSEFQSWFLARQADDVVRSQGLAKNGATRLKEAGFTESQIAELTPGQAQQALERLGLKVYQPNQLFGSGRKPTSGTALENQWITPFAERNLMGAIESPGLIEKILLEGIYDPAINAWKVWALPLRLGWQVNNLAGSALLTTLVGQVSPFDYPALFRASRAAVSDWNQGIPSTVKIPVTDTYRAELVARLQKLDTGSSEATRIREWLDSGYIELGNDILDELSSSGLTRGDFAWMNNSQFLRDIGANSQKNLLQQFDINVPEVPGRVGERARNLRQSGREVVDLAYHINENVDNMHRMMIYLDQIGKGALHPEAKAHMIKTLGDYNKMTGFERRVLKRIYPFYPWMRHITEVVASSLTPDNITRTVIFTHLSNIMGQPNEWEEMLPEWAGGHIYMGMDDNGKPKFLSTRGLNPFLDVFDPVAQPNMRGLLRPSNPFIQFGYEQVSGTSVLTGRPFSSPGQAYGQTTSDPPTPPVGEYLFRNIPQLGTARDIYRDLMGQPLTRYGTGEAAFFEGAEEGRSSLQDVQQLFGYNVRPMDVEQMRERELVRELAAAEAQAKYEEQLEQQGGRQARDLLNALPGLGG